MVDRHVQILVVFEVLEGDIVDIGVILKYQPRGLLFQLFLFFMILFNCVFLYLFNPLIDGLDMVQLLIDFSTAGVQGKA